jgi:hypothetical protein
MNASKARTRSDLKKRCVKFRKNLYLVKKEACNDTYKLLFVLEKIGKINLAVSHCTNTNQVGDRRATVSGDTPLFCL